MTDPAGHGLFFTTTGLKVGNLLMGSQPILRSDNAYTLTHNQRSFRLAELPEAECLIRMRTCLSIRICLLALSTCFVFCHSTHPSAEASQATGQINDTMNYRIRIRAGAATFTATLEASPASEAFVALLPLTLNMQELNNNEKYAALPGRLPTREITPGQIRAGDLMLYGSNTLVLFYESFSSGYRYTPLGQLDSVAGLKAALGSGAVMVTFERE